MTYRPPYFRVDDRATLLPLIEAHPLATLVTAHDGGISLTYVPLLARSNGDELFLEGHIARANEQWKHRPTSALAAFKLAQHYISPTWYPSKRSDPRTVPTYDYVAIEARGELDFVHDEGWLRSFVARLSDGQERRVGGSWSIDDAPEEYLISQLRAIVGVRLRVSSLTGTFKLNQNHPPENIASVVASLEALGSAEASTLAAFMRKATGI